MMKLDDMISTYNKFNDSHLECVVTGSTLVLLINMEEITRGDYKHIHGHVRTILHERSLLEFVNERRPGRKKVKVGSIHDYTIWQDVEGFYSVLKDDHPTSTSCGGYKKLSTLLKLMGL